MLLIGAMNFMVDPLQISSPGAALAVSFQEVVHPVRNEEAEGYGAERDRRRPCEGHSRAPVQRLGEDGRQMGQAFPHGRCRWVA